MTVRIKSREEMESIGEEAQRVQREYAYMDQLSFDGWMWEMIRRTPKYKERMRDCRTERNTLRAFVIYKFLNSWRKKFQAVGLDVFFTEGEHSPEEYHIIKFRSGPYLALPFHSKKYSEFTTEKPSIFGSRLVQPLEYSDIRKWKKKVEDEDGRTDIASIDELIHMLSPVGATDTVYLGISKVGKKEDVRKEVSRVLDQYHTLRRKKRRTDKWKYCLIVYDLVEDEGYIFAKISNILHEAYPNVDKLSEETNIGNYYHAAQRLIDLGSYKKYLSTSFQGK